MSETPSPHLGVPDAELFSSMLGRWSAEVSRIIEYMERGNYIRAAALLGELKADIEARDQECADAWDMPHEPKADAA
jgi:tRNA U54 and U55 pseudouridine synthase Pus10